ncbi:MAG: hypothetical protein CSA26_01290 [Desulfobacterales bacterium]|nr:MAG: hypothetical protein CSA26_01290 [Desulfobacterales bacterium]
MKTHICLVSDQPLPNVIPALHEKIDHIVLLSSPEMIKNRNLLQRFFKERNVKVSLFEIDAYDFNLTLAVCKKMLDDNNGEDLTLNLTGGTKMAALAAWQQCWFSTKKVRIIYVDTANRLLHELGDHLTSELLPANLLTVKEYLVCFGKKMLKNEEKKSRREKKRRQATAELASFLVHNPNLQRKINRIVSEYENQSKKRTASPYLYIDPEVLGKKGERFCTILLKTGIGTKGLDGGINLNSEKDRFYVGGGWLEEFVYDQIDEQRIPDIDLHMNVHIAWLQQEGKTVQNSNGPTTNELDVVFTWQNRLHVISCKTSAIDQIGGKVKGKDALYELDSLHAKIGGTYARAMLVSVHSLNTASRKRAQDMGIEIITGPELLRFSHHLEEKWGIREPHTD